MKSEGFVGLADRVTGQDALDYIGALATPLRVDTFHFNRAFMQAEGTRLTDFGGAEFQTGRALSLPPQYLMVLRVVVGWFSILSQIDCTSRTREIVVEWVPGFTDYD